MTDWADEIAEAFYMQRNATATALREIQINTERKARAQGWRECASYLFSPNQGEGVSPSDAKLWEQCNLEAAKIEKGEN